jgi:hypothetical protein
MKSILVTAALILGLAGVPAFAQEGPPLGRYHFTVATGPMVMQHVTFATDDAGIHFGLAGYRHMGRNWYLGAELGVGGSLAVFGASSDIGMIEANGKYVVPLGGTFRLDLGGGFSYNHVTYDEFSFFGEDSPAIDDWVLGAQVLSNANVKLGPLILGAHVKYMLTADVAGVQEIEDLEKGWDYSHLRFGLQVGFLIR